MDHSRPGRRSPPVRHGREVSLKNMKVRTTRPYQYRLLASGFPPGHFAGAVVKERASLSPLLSGFDYHGARYENSGGRGERLAQAGQCPCASRLIAEPGTTACRGAGSVPGRPPSSGRHDKERATRCPLLFILSGRGWTATPLLVRARNPSPADLIIVAMRPRSAPSLATSPPRELIEAHIAAMKTPWV